MMNDKIFQNKVNEVLNRMNLGNYCIGVDDDGCDKIVNYEVYDAKSNTYTKIRKIIVGAYDEDGNETSGLYGVVQIIPEEDAMRYTYHTVDNLINKGINGFSEYLDHFDDEDKDFVYNDDESDVMIELCDYSDEGNTNYIVAEIITLIINNEETKDITDTEEIEEIIYNALRDAGLEGVNVTLNNGDEAVIEFWTDYAGQDIYRSAYHDGTLGSVLDELIETAESYDVDEEVEIFVPIRGQRGVPESVRAIVEDCEEAKATLTEIADVLQELRCKI